ncbi:HsdM family class I SAM-dependent methyltransferase [Billgrantia desiderata]|uniref:HsdM family class I SAM-dependent methyltransferase n=1 Tax=Billgrantia desiderata TaxID=52021 RepID=UPI00089EB598|nr:N-6 DNA methylase [Halomonas desiderata]SEG30144.1 Type I restriction-modification system, DNA methylase subunit [Halomonas desiderata]
MADLAGIITEFGGDPAGLRLLDSNDPDLLPYATLLTTRRTGSDPLGSVSAVYEWQGAPLVFLVDADTLQDDNHLHKIRRLLAMRGDAPYLGVVGPGRLEVYRIALDRKSPQQARVDWGNDQNGRAAAFARLGNVRPEAAISQRNWISNVVLNLLTGSITRLIVSSNVTDEDAISLVGRALFTRFLADRELLPAALSSIEGGAGLFDNQEIAKKTSTWLDETFNGDLLPLSDEIFAKLPDHAYQTLGDVLRRAPDSQLFLGWKEKWDNLDFAHIPVGVLSQAYELYLRSHAPLRQRREGGFYTPRPIADLMVRASFRALERQDLSHKAKVLDPAAGAGVFLLTAFRELVAEHWRIEGKRPDTNALRSILYEQIVGFDINETALRFAALGLYLISIELDPNPQPVDKLRFKDLRGKVLHRIGTGGEEEGAELGSLGPLVGDEHIARYDLVIGNPPWSSGTGLPDWHLVRKTIARIAAKRNISIVSPPLPNEGLDLPFVWRAMEWAKADGQIAFALHARLLFLQGDGMGDARQALFEALDVTSVINGVELRQTKVWPEITAPFCILFAKNRIPGPSAGFRLISPRIEASLNEAGAMRIDALNAEVIPSKQFAHTPEILKVLFRGTKADLGILERLRNHGYPTLEAFWREAIGTTSSGQLSGSGNGYQKLRPSSTIRRKGDGMPGVDAYPLYGLPEITATTFSRVSIKHERLTPFMQERVHRLRSQEIYSGPLVIVHEAPPVTTGRIGVAISEADVVFNQSFYGYSPRGFSDAHLFVRYLALVFGSKLAMWIALVTSGRFGIEREVVEKATLDRMPLPDFRKFSVSQKAEIKAIFEKLSQGKISWNEVDEWVLELYGLGQRDQQVIADTLHFSLPFAHNRREAQATPSEEEQIRFCEALEAELSPWCERFGSKFNVQRLDQPIISPWYGIEIRASRPNDDMSVDASDWVGLLRAADDAAASEIILRSGADTLLIGRLAQRRYWSETQARLLAQRIIWSHVDLFERSSIA